MHLVIISMLQSLLERSIAHAPGRMPKFKVHLDGRRHRTQEPDQSSPGDMSAVEVPTASVPRGSGHVQ